MDINTTWFLVLSILLTGYAILDGFDFGVGVLHLFAKNDMERRIHVNAIGPVWDGNEVWLITAGAALFAAFPIVYATVFSGFYLALMLLLTALIFRAVSFEFRGKVDSPGWTKLWDWSFGVGSLLCVVLFGVAIGNILRGVPIGDNGEYLGTFLGLLNPYSILIGVLALVGAIMHGAAYMTLKTDGDLLQRMIKNVNRFWIAFVVLYVIATFLTVLVSPFLFENTLSNPLFWLLLIVFLAAVAYIPIALKAGKYGRVFLASSVVIATVLGQMVLGMYPKLVPSSLNLTNSLTIYNASSTDRTLTVMLIIALIGMPLVIVYTAYMYRVFKGKTEITPDSY